MKVSDVLTCVSIAGLGIALVCSMKLYDAQQKQHKQMTLRAVEYGFTKSRKGWSKEYTIERFREEIFDVVPKD